MENEIDLRFSLNGKIVTTRVEPRQVLADFLREEAVLLGTKISCDQGACGACTVLRNGMPVAACSTFTFEVDGMDVTTVETRDEDDPTLRVLREEFAAVGALQCGFCTAGMLMFAKSVLDGGIPLGVEEIRRQLTGNWCRCTGYGVIVDAILSASKRLHARKTMP